MKLRIGLSRPLHVRIYTHQNVSTRQLELVTGLTGQGLLTRSVSEMPQHLLLIFFPYWDPLTILQFDD